MKRENIFCITQEESNGDYFVLDCYYNEEEAQKERDKYAEDYDQTFSVVETDIITKPNELHDFIERQEKLWGDMDAIEELCSIQNETVAEWLQEELYEVIKLYLETNGGQEL